MTLEQEILIKEAKAHKAGYEEGLEKGRIEERLLMAKSLKDKGIPIEVIADCTGLVKDKINAL